MERPSSNGLSIDTKRKRKASSAQPWHSVEDDASPEKGYDSPSKKRSTREDTLFETANRLFRAKSTSRGRSRPTTPQSPSPLPGAHEFRSASEDGERSAGSDRKVSESVDSRDAATHGGRRVSTEDKDFPAQHAAPTVPNRRYVDLLNHMIACVNDPGEHLLDDARTSDLTFADSQVGLSFWTSAEKDKLFKAISRFGVHDLARISSHIGTKSELEVRQYIVLIDDAISGDPSRFWYQRHPAPPVAAEISERTCKLADQAAEDVGAYQAATDAQWEKHYFGAYWLLNRETALALEKLLEGTQTDARTSVLLAGDTNSNVRSRLVPPMHLLRLPEWLSLSAYFFTNASAPAAIEEPPSAPPPQAAHPSQFMPGMHATTALDFHALTVSVTRRLVAAALFQADCRLRARESAVSEVSLGDVEAAIDVLGMSRDTVAFWARVPRRCRLDVYDYEPANRSWPVLWGKDVARADRIGGLGRRLTYNEVETRLGLERASPTSDEADHSAEVSLDESSASDGESTTSSIPGLPSEPSTRSPSPSLGPDPEDLALQSILNNTSPEPPATRPLRTRRPDSPPQWPRATAPAAEWELHGALPASAFPSHAAADPDLVARIHARWTGLAARSSTSRSRSRSRASSSNAAGVFDTDNDGDVRMDEPADVGEGGRTSEPAGDEEGVRRGRAPVRRELPLRGSRSRTPRYVVDSVEAGVQGSDDDNDEEDEGSGSGEEIADSEGEDGAGDAARARAIAVRARELEMQRDMSDGDEYMPSSPVER